MMIEHNQLPQLPATGFVRASKLLLHVPFAKSTLWSYSKDGRFPAPIKVGSMTCWRLEDVHAWFAAQGKAVVPDAANDAGGQ